MSRPPAACVVDASAAMPLFLPETLSAKADRLFAVRNGELERRLHVPDLFYAECANVLWKAARRLRVSPTMALASVQELLAMDLVWIPTNLLAEEALRAAMSHEVSAYDACYVALGAQLRVPLFTADGKLVEKFRGSSFDVRWLGDLDR